MLNLVVRKETDRLLKVKISFTALWQKQTVDWQTPLKRSEYLRNVL